MLSFLHIYSIGEAINARKGFMWLHNYWAKVRGSLFAILQKQMLG